MPRRKFPSQVGPFFLSLYKRLQALVLNLLSQQKNAPKNVSLGLLGERYAERYLRKQGYIILETRRLTKFSELDIIAVDNQNPKQKCIVFVEVKTRSSHIAGSPFEAIDEEKKRRLTQAALAYLKSHGLLEQSCRFDVIGLCWPSEEAKPALTHIENAFSATGIRQFYS